MDKVLSENELVGKRVFMIQYWRNKANITTNHSASTINVLIASELFPALSQPLQDHFRRHGHTAIHSGTGNDLGF